MLSADAQHRGLQVQGIGARHDDESAGFHHAFPKRYRPIQCLAIYAPSPNSVAYNRSRDESLTCDCARWTASSNPWHARSGWDRPAPGHAFSDISQDDFLNSPGNPIALSSGPGGGSDHHYENGHTELYACTGTTLHAL